MVSGVSPRRRYHPDRRCRPHRHPCQVPRCCRPWCRRVPHRAGRWVSRAGWSRRFSGAGAAGEPAPGTAGDAGCVGSPVPYRPVRAKLGSWSPGRSSRWSGWLSRSSTSRRFPRCRRTRRPVVRTPRPHRWRRRWSSAVAQFMLRALPGQSFLEPRERHGGERLTRCAQTGPESGVATSVTVVDGHYCIPVKHGGRLPRPVPIQPGRTVEPPVRIELTTYALQERCSTAELRRRVSLDCQSLSASPRLHYSQCCARSKSGSLRRAPGGARPGHGRSVGRSVNRSLRNPPTP